MFHVTWVIFTKWFILRKKLKAPVKKEAIISLRKIRNVHDVSNIPYQVYEIFYGVDDAYWFYESRTRQFIDKHAPLKKKIIRTNQTPYMNGPLRRNYYKRKPPANWEIYGQHRNNVTERRRQRMKEYLPNTRTKSDCGKRILCKK